jgi:hypothetical protein
LILSIVEIKQVVGMKILSGIVTRPRPTFAFLCMIMIAFAQTTTRSEPATPASHMVTIEKDVILIHPGTKLAKPDQKELNRILARYDKSLYKIETYKKGQVIMTQGELSDMLIDKTIASEAANAKASGGSHRTLQIIAATTSQQLLGTTTNPQKTPSATTSPTQGSPSATTNPTQGSPSATTNPTRASPSATTNPTQGSPSATTNPTQGSPSATTNPTQGSPSATTNPTQESPSATTNPTQGSPSATTNPQQHSPSPVGEKASRELIERLKPILEKYSKK